MRILTLALALFAVEAQAETITFTFDQAAGVSGLPYVIDGIDGTATSDMFSLDATGITATGAASVTGRIAGDFGSANEYASLTIEGLTIADPINTNSDSGGIYADIANTIPLASLTAMLLDGLLEISIAQSAATGAVVVGELTITFEGVRAAEAVPGAPAMSLLAAAMLPFVWRKAWPNG